MLKILYKLIKRIVFSVFFIYGYNILTSSLGYMIPLNIYTVLIVSILGLPAFISLVAIQIFVF